VERDSLNAANAKWGKRVFVLQPSELALDRVPTPVEVAKLL
jgi:hypothetical protein